MNSKDTDRFFMRQALLAAEKAASQDEVPVGAVLVSASGEQLAASGNRCVQDADPCGHAEVIALREAAKKIGNYRLIGSTLYVTLEPCVMCVGAMIHARIFRLVFAASDPKTGAVMSRYRIADDGLLNHTLQVEHGLYATESSALLKDFFRKKRRGRITP